jgi:hypothetical protein
MTDQERQQRLSRLQTEALYLASKYGAVNYDHQDGTWLHIARFPVAPEWNKPFVELLLDIPQGTPGYPWVAPSWFWTDSDLRTREGHSIQHFFITGSSHADLQHLEKGWGHFCIHVKSWRPSPGRAITRGDSLLTYVEAIRRVFHDRKRLGT